MAQCWSAGVVATALLLAGCAAAPTAPPSRSDFEDMRAAVTSSRGARDAVEAQCRSDVLRKPADERALMGAMLDVDAIEVPDEFCARLVAAIARGDIGYADFVAMTEGSEDPGLLRRFLRTMRLDPSAVAI